MLRILGLIPARGGSKGVPRKNIRPLLGRPLLAYTADAALGARSLSRIVLSTEDEEIAAVGVKCGIEVPFLRPQELARDETPTLPVVQHALGELEARGDRFDAICLLQPTTPMRTSEDIDGCVALFAESGADAVATILAVPAKFNPHWVYFMTATGDLRVSTGAPSPISRRQDLPRAFRREGSVYVIRRNVVVEQNSLYGQHLVGFEVNADRSIDIDTLDDWERAERMVGACPA
jgi:CMP-N,N'-diacetyllegionaminic acid synthase